MTNSTPVPWEALIRGAITKVVEHAERAAMPMLTGSAHHTIAKIAGADHELDYYREHTA